MADQSDLVREWLQRAELGPAGRVPPERELAMRLGLSRAELRKSLGALERSGAITRHVGRGTFLTEPGGARPAPPRAEAASPAAMKPPSPPSAEPVRPSAPRAAQDQAPAQLALPFASAPEASAFELAEARLALEPRLAALASRRASRSEIAEIRRAEADLLLAAAKGASLQADRRFHRAIALATRNRALIQAFDELARLSDDLPVRPGPEAAEARSRGPASDEHRRIVEAILRGDHDGAEEAARDHILREEATFLGPPF